MHFEYSCIFVHAVTENTVGEKRKKMNHEDDIDPWFSLRPEAPPWDAAEYNQLISAGPLLPLLEQYANIGMMHDQKRNS